jgi:hypothetical protein
MAWETTLNGTSPTGQRVEWQERKRAGHSAAERQARVKVSGRTVVSGWVSDGTTYDAYARIIRAGLSPEERERLS